MVAQAEHDQMDINIPAIGCSSGKDAIDKQVLWMRQTASLLNWSYVRYPLQQMVTVCLRGKE
jgi:hypothetical protein